MTVPGPAAEEYDGTVRCQCGEPILRDSPRFRQGGPTALLCWVCARLAASVAREMALGPQDPNY